MWTALLIAAATAGTCDKTGLEKLAGALGSASKDQRVSLAAVGFSEACPSSPLAGAAASIAQSPHDYLPVLDAKSVLDDPASWLAVCTDGIAVAQRVAQVAASEKRSVAWNGCDLALQGWFSQSEWAGASGTTFLSLSVGSWLKRNGVPAGQTRSIVRGLAGIGGAAGGRHGFDLIDVAPLIPVPVTEPPVMEEPPQEEIPEEPVEVAITEPSFVGKPVVKWHRAAKKSAVDTCRLVLTVRKSGTLGKVDWSECPDALRKDVEKALADASFKAGEDADGTPVRADFTARFKVR